jgi:hypothetical protein
LPPTSNDDEYIYTLENEDNKIEESSNEKKEEVKPPLCGVLQAALVGSFESAHKSSTTRDVCVIILKQTNTAIANLLTEILMEFIEKGSNRYRAHGGLTVGHQRS